MQKKPIIVLIFAALAITTFSNRAISGRNSEYEPLYWNGPAGYGDYNILFDGPEEPGFLHKIINRPFQREARKCRVLRKRYLRTGHRKWLRKYRICRVDNY